MFPFASLNTMTNRISAHNDSDWILYDSLFMYLADLENKKNVNNKVVRLIFKIR